MQNQENTENLQNIPVAASDNSTNQSPVALSKNPINGKHTSPPPYRSENGTGTHPNLKTVQLNGKDMVQQKDAEHNEVIPKLEKKNSLIYGGDGAHAIAAKHRTSYLETMMHLLKGNIGTGIFAMGDAVMNGGLFVGPFIIIFLGVVCTYCMHILIKCSTHVKDKKRLIYYPDYAETVEACFEDGPPKLRRHSKLMHKLIIIFLCITQLGFCCVYMVFIAENMKAVYEFFGIVFSEKLHLLIMLVPIWLPSLITNLKYLVPCSAVANVCILSGIGIIFYYLALDLPAIESREWVGKFNTIPLSFGTAIFAFEGICLVLPLKNQMKVPKQFDAIYGVLNMGMIGVILLYAFIGFLGYLKYGDTVQGSISLNLPKTEVLALLVKLSVSLAVLLTYPLQLYVAINVMWPSLIERFQIKNNLLLKELIFRTLVVLFTFGIAEAVPNLGAFISLIGSLCSTSLALVFPPMTEFIVAYSSERKGLGFMSFLLNIVILLLALLGFATGTFESIRTLIKSFIG